MITDSNSEIVITHFKDPNIVYFRSNAPLFIQMYKAMIKKVHEHCLRCTYLLVCLYFYSFLKLYFQLYKF